MSDDKSSCELSVVAMLSDTSYRGYSVTYDDR